jgi:2-polyprenyl-3-methyl-5-hydroxy-6-metoxy-1,4-benzoquinol methylase
MPSLSELTTRLLFRFADEKSVIQMQRSYVRFFSDAGCKRVLDLGSGRGLFLELLRTAGIDGIGVDGSEEVSAEVRGRGFTVHTADVLTFLRQAAEEKQSYDGVFCSHLIEHLSGELAIELVSLVATVVRPGGRVVFVTPNIANPLVGTKVFWLDLTHVRPYPRLLLQALLDEVGFRVLSSYDDNATLRGYFRSWGSLVALGNDLARHGRGVLTGMDAVVVAERR